jgi:MFS family permease
MTTRNLRPRVIAARFVPGLSNRIKHNLSGPVREMRWSYLPPLMVYFAAGISGFTGIIESFFVKEELGLSAGFLAGLGFWAGLPWALKMPLGHLVDLFWRRKSLFVYLGAALMSASLLIMVGLTGYSAWMKAILGADTWYVIAVMLAPIGFVLQDVVADAMTVEAVPDYDADGSRIPEKKLQQMHVTMQTLGRIAIVGGGATVAGVGGWLATVLSYAAMYWISLLIPLISILGVLLASWMRIPRKDRLSNVNPEPQSSQPIRGPQEQAPEPNWYILAGSALFVIVGLILGLSAISVKQETIFLASLGIIVLLMGQILKDLSPAKRREIISLAVIIFVFRAMPTAGAGAGWWQIDVLGFDEAFFGTLRQISALLAIAGMFVLRGWMARRPIPYLVLFLSVYSAVMMAPLMGMYYGLHEWTQATLGFGARTIALIDTMADSPLGQVAMIPMLAWIAKEAPKNQKATYFAVMAAFTNLALSASHLGTKYLNKIFVIERGQYNELGILMISVALIGLTLPIATVAFFNPANGLAWKKFNHRPRAKSSGYHYP